jgi:hypothetical protein
LFRQTLEESTTGTSTVPRLVTNGPFYEGGTYRDLVFNHNANASIGMCSAFSAKMKKLVHNLTLTVEGPDEGQIRQCVSQAAAVGLIVAIAAAYATGGLGLSAAISAFLTALLNCLGATYTARVDDRSHWEEWCT